MNQESLKQSCLISYYSFNGPIIRGDLINPKAEKEDEKNVCGLKESEKEQQKKLVNFPHRSIIEDYWNKFLFQTWFITQNVVSIMSLDDSWTNKVRKNRVGLKHCYMIFFSCKCLINGSKPLVDTCSGQFAN